MSVDNIFVVLGNQLFHPNFLKEKNCNHVFMAEDFGLCTYQKHHKLKIYLFLCAMREYREELERKKIAVSYFTLNEREDELTYCDFLIQFCTEKNVKKINLLQKNKYVNLAIHKHVIYIRFLMQCIKCITKKRTWTIQ